MIKFQVYRRKDIGSILKMTGNKPVDFFLGTMGRPTFTFPEGWEMVKEGRFYEGFLGDMADMDTLEEIMFEVNCKCLLANNGRIKGSLSGGDIVRIDAEHTIFSPMTGFWLNMEDIGWLKLKGVTVPEEGD